VTALAVARRGFAGFPRAHEARFDQPEVGAAVRAFEEVFQRNLKDSPVFQSQLGLKGPAYGRWDDFSDEERQRQDALNRQELERLRSEFRYDQLSDKMKVSYRIFEEQQETSIRNFKWRWHGYTFQTQANPATSLVTFMQNVHGIASVADADLSQRRLRRSLSANDLVPPT